MCKPLQQLKEAIQSDLDKNNIAIFMHDCPDPDSIASALGLERLLKEWNEDILCQHFHGGEISHSQNKTLINVLNIPLTNVNEVEDIDNKFDHFICVDVMPERCLKDVEFLMAIDHHKVDTKKAKIVDIREIGATSTIIFEYLQKEGICFKEGDDKDQTIATALLVGIKTDTSDLVSENVTAEDFEAYKNLIGYVDRAKLSSITDYPLPSYLFKLRSELEKEENIRIDNGVFVGGIGTIAKSKRDVLPILAGERARLNEISTSFVFGIVDDNIEVSVRSVGLEVDVNSLCQKIFGKEYSGGKSGEGAAKIPLYFLSLDANTPDEIKEKQWEFVKAYVIDRIFHVINNM